MADRWIWKSWCETGKFKTLVNNWLADQDKYVQTQFKVRLKFLDGQPPQNWRRPFVSTLNGGKKDGGKGCKGLVEIRFEVKNVQYRPLGYYSGKQEFTIVFFAKEVGGKFEPETACSIAKARIAEIEADPKKAYEWWIETRTDT